MIEPIHHVKISPTCVPNYWGGLIISQIKLCPICDCHTFDLVKHCEDMNDEIHIVASVIES